MFLAKQLLTFTEAANNFIELSDTLYWKASTLYGYKNYLKNHLLPFFGKMKLIDITPNKILFYRKEKHKAGLSNNTINKTLVLLGSIFKQMVDSGFVLHNPVRKVKKLPLPHLEMKFLKTREVAILLSTAEKFYPDFYPLIFTAIFTGIRRGELFGLTWDKINWTTKKLCINKSLYKRQMIDPKTHSSIRDIDISDELLKVLKNWRTQCPESKGNFVFPSPEGSIPDPDNYIKRRFHPLLETAGIEKIRFHDLRHTYASILTAKCAPPLYIKKQMGHSSIQVTMDRYGHLMPEVHEFCVKALNDYFNEL